MSRHYVRMGALNMSELVIKEDVWFEDAEYAARIDAGQGERVIHVIAPRFK